MARLVRIRRLLALLALCLDGRLTASEHQWIAPGAIWRWQAVGSGSIIDETWTHPAHDDSTWPTGVAGFSAGYSGYQQAATVLPTLLSDGLLRGIRLRHAFVLDSTPTIAPSGALWLRLEYEDAVRVWLNGQEVFRGGYSSGPTVEPVTHPLGTAELIDLSAFRHLLIAGTNVLAIQVLDASTWGASVFVWPELRVHFSRGPAIHRVTERSADVVWHGPPGAESWVDWAPEGDEVWRRGEANTREGESDVTLEGLEPGTAYRYRVGLRVEGVTVTSEPAVFRTLKGQGDFRFLVMGDSGAGLAPGYAVAGMVEREDPDFVLHVGDIVYPSFTRGRVDLRCFSVLDRVLRQAPLFPTFGNHELYGSESDYAAAFRLPTNSVTGSERFYSFDHGSAHFVSLFVPHWLGSELGVRAADGGPGPQLAWLMQDLAATRKPWKFVYFHQPMRSSGPHVNDDYDFDGRRDSAQLLETLLPVFDQHGVQLVFHGHDHFWERLAPTNGMHTVITGGGGAFLYPAIQRDPASARVVVNFHATRVESRGDALSVEAIDTAGRILDSMVIGLPGGHQEPPTLEAAWHSPTRNAGGRSNGDGNRLGELFDFPGPAHVSTSGRSANLGRLQVTQDDEFIRVGLREVMIRSDQTLVLLVGSPRLPGVTTIRGMGAVLSHPLGGLDLRMEGFEPAVVCLLGDEWADSNDPGFVRSGTSIRMGQGVFHLDARLTPVPGASLRQFNRSPEGEPDIAEQNADFIEVTLPRSALGGVLPGETLEVGAVVATPFAITVEPEVRLDSAVIGRLDAGSANEPGTGGLDEDIGGVMALSPVRVTLGFPPHGDLDLDGLGPEDEVRWGCDPRNPDSDSDGLPDGWEVAHALNPLRSTGVDGAAGDPDGDGYDNGVELRSGTDPRDATPTLKIEGKVIGSGIELTWRAMMGWRYDVEFAEHVSGPYVSLGLEGFPREAREAQERLLLTSPLRTGAEEANGGVRNPSARWFRVREWPPEHPSLR